MRLPLCLPYCFISFALLLGACTAPGGKVASPDVAAELTIGARSSLEVTPSNTGDSTSEQGDASTGGVVGNIGGDGDSVGLWIAIVCLTVLALSAYPAQRAARLAWNSWRGQSSPSTKGVDLCIKFSRRDS